MKPCPFCGMTCYPDIDTLYPAGYGWKEDDEGRYYVTAYEVPKEQWCYKLMCNESYGGCGATLYGDSKEEVIAKWNRRVNK